MSQFSDVAFDGLYGAAIMDHYRNPRHRDPLSSADMSAHEFNPFCGDEVTLRAQLDETGRFTRISSQSQGCSIIQASASMMAEGMEGKSAEELEELARLFRELMQGREMSEEGPGQAERPGRTAGGAAIPGADQVRPAALDRPGRGAGPVAAVSGELKRWPDAIAPPRVKAGRKARANGRAAP